jgi:hypothetical protein
MTRDRDPLLDLRLVAGKPRCRERRERASPAGRSAASSSGWSTGRGAPRRFGGSVAPPRPEVKAGAGGLRIRHRACARYRTGAWTDLVRVGVLVPRGARIARRGSFSGACATASLHAGRRATG